MTWIERTAYPRLPRAVSLKELRESFTPSDDEMAWALTHTQSDRQLLALVIGTCPACPVVGPWRVRSLVLAGLGQCLYRVLPRGAKGGRNDRSTGTSGLTCIGPDAQLTWLSV